MTGKLLLAAILCLMGGNALGDVIMEGNYNVTAFCSAVRPGIQLGSIVSCEYYYNCTSTGPVKSWCPTGSVWDFKTSSCLVGGKKCYWGVADPCAGRNNTWVPNTTTCGGYHYCLNGVILGSGSCPPGYKFDAYSGKCMNGMCSELVESDQPNLVTPCDVVPSNFYFGDTDACSVWNYCKEDGTLISGTCTGDTSAFVVNTAVCSYYSIGYCSRVTGNQLISVRQPINEKPEL